MKKSQATARSVRRKKKIRLILGASGALLLVLLLATGLYVQSLLGLVQDDTFTGNPSIAERDLGEPADETGATHSATTRSVQPVKHDPTPEPTETTLSEMELAVLAAEAGLTEAIASIPVASSRNVQTILLIGTDNRGNEINGRSDTMMLLSINKSKREIQLVSLMRALYVQVPNHGFSMLNAAFSWGGPKLLMRTINDNFRLNITDYIVIDFHGFEKAIDAVGGVAVDLDEREIKYLQPLYPEFAMQAGSNLLNGPVALEYVRIRKIDSDFVRTSRQREVIAALINSLSGLSAGEVDGLARQVLPLVKTSFSSSELIGLAVDGLRFHSWPIKQLMLPVRNSHEMAVVRGTQMELFDAQANIEALHNMLFSS